MSSSTSLTAATIQQVNMYNWKADTLTVAKTEQMCTALSEYFHRLANEPSIGLHHVSTHMYAKGIPRIVTAKEELQKCTVECDNAVAYDVTESLRSVRAMHELVAFKNTKVVLVCLFFFLLFCMFFGLITLVVVVFVGCFEVWGFMQY
jgi:hypothetical protein